MEHIVHISSRNAQISLCILCFFSLNVVRISSMENEWDMGSVK
jgi:hypothetical protein